MDQHLQGQQGLGAESPGETILITRPPVHVPLNLSEWVIPEVLSAWVREVAKEPNPANPPPANSTQRPTDQEADRNLRVLLFAYCTQRFHTTEIVHACHSDEALRELCDRKIPFARELRTFRQHHRALLESRLAELLLRAGKVRFMKSGPLPPGLQNSLIKTASGLVDSADVFDSDDPDEED